MERIIILSILIAQTFAAPNGCIDSCRTYQSESYRSQQRVSGHTDNAHLGQVNVENQSLLNSDYARPGNWTEHNQYRTDGGQGQVHEQRGQYVEGPKRVRFYKKNYTSSYSTGYTNGGAATTAEQIPAHTGQHSAHTPDRGYYDRSQISQSQYERTGGSEVVHQDRDYSRLHNTHLHSQTSDSQSQRLEDFGEYTGHTQTAQHGVTGHEARSSAQHGSDSGTGNWSTADTYRTEDGRGRVYEEKGQYVTGPKKVQYYRKNFTSSYGTSGDHVNHDLEREMQTMMRELHRDMQQSIDSRHVSTSNVMHTGAADLSQGTMRSGHRNADLHASESASYGQRNDHEHGSVDNTAHRYSQNLYVRGQPSDYATEDRSTYEQTRHTYVTRPQPVSHSTNPSADIIRVPLGGRNDYQRNIYDSRLSHQQFIDEQQRAERLNSHQSRVLNHDAINENVAQNVYTQNTDRYPNRSGHVRQYEEHWSSSGSTGNIPVPDYSGTHGGQHISQSQYGTTRHTDEHSSYRGTQGHNTYVGQPNNYNPVYTTSPGKLVTGTIDLGHGQHTVDCTQEEVGHNHRMYKRSAKYRESDDMHPQETDDLNQAKEGFEDFAQHVTQTPERIIKIEFGPHGPHMPMIPPGQGGMGTGINNDEELQAMLHQIKDVMDELEKLQNYGEIVSRNITFGHQSHEHSERHQNMMHRQEHFRQYGQHTSGNMGSNNHVPHWPHMPGTVAQQPGDFTHQTSQDFDSGHQTQDPHRTRMPETRYPHHSGDFTQQNEDLTQQTGGFEDFTQQTSDDFQFGHHPQDPYRPRRPGTGNSPHSSDLTQESEDLTQQTGGFDDFTQQTSGGLEFGRQTQDPYRTRRPGTGHSPHSTDLAQKNDDLTQQTGGFGDFTQQTSGDLELGQQTQNPFLQRHPSTGQPSRDVNPQNGDLTQQTGGFGDFTQQTSDGLEFGQQTQDMHKPRKPGTSNPSHSGDLTQQSEDLTQQTGGFDDFTQQTSGDLELGQQTQNPFLRRRPGTAQQSGDFTQQNEDLTQQTGGFGDFTQQTSGDLQLGQQTQNPYKPGRPNNSQQTGDMTQQNEDLTQQTGGFEDLTQQTSGGLEFGQQTQDPHRPRRPGTRNSPHSGDLTQHNEDLTQQTGGFDDLTQQTSGDLQFGEHPQNPHRPRRPETRNPPRTGDMTQENEDLTQQTGGFDDLTQQTSGDLEFGQHPQDPHRPRRPETRNPPRTGDMTQENEDLTQQTGGFDDLTQQTSGDLEFGQHPQDPHRPRRPETRNPPRTGDMTQENEDLTQQTGGFDDLTQQTSGDLEFGQHPQNPHRPRRPETRNPPRTGDMTQENEDLTQQTGGFDDLTQQTSGDLEFGQHPQDPHRPRRPETRNPPRTGDMTQENEDLTQQTGGFDDLTQQTSGDLEFGQHPQNPYSPRKPETRNPPRTGDMTQQNEDLTQHTGGFEDLTQQTSGNLEFGQHPQNPYRPRRPETRNPPRTGDMTQENEDLTQQIGRLDDLTQQTSGGLEFGQHPEDRYKPQRPGTTHSPHSGDMTQQSEDLTQQTGGLDDLTQQTSGDLQFGQHPQDPYRPRRPETRNPPRTGDMTLENEGLTQQTGGFDDLTQQTSGDLEFGQHPQNPYRPRRPSHPRLPGDFSQDGEDLTQQTGDFGDFSQQTSDLEFGQQPQKPSDMNNVPGQLPRRPAPKPRPRYQQRQYPNNEGTTSDKVNEPVEINVEVDDDDVRTGQLGRGDQSLANVKPSSTESPQKPDTDKLGTQWHYSHNLGDLTNSEPTPDSSRSTVNDNSMTQQTPVEPPREQLGVKTSRRRYRPRSEPNSQYPQDIRYQTNWTPYQPPADTGFGSTQKQSNNVDYGQVTEEIQQQRRFTPVESKIEGKVEPRILQAYGGGPYDSERDGDVFDRVTPNPSVTIPPNVEGFEPWDVREKPRYFPAMTDAPLPTVQPLDITTEIEGESTVPTEKPPNFWGRLGTRITTGFDKAKEKVRNVFG